MQHAIVLPHNSSTSQTPVQPSHVPFLTHNQKPSLCTLIKLLNVSHRQINASGTKMRWRFFQLNSTERDFLFLLPPFWLEKQHCSSSCNFSFERDFSSRETSRSSLRVGKCVPEREGGTFEEQKPIICTLPFHIPHPCHIPHSTPLLKLHYMQRAEHLRDVYVRAQMWKAV